MILKTLTDCTKGASILLKKQKLILFITIPFSLLLGGLFGLNIKDVDGHENHNSSVNPLFNSLEEELWHSDLIIKGTVLEEISTFQQDSGIDTPLGRYKFDVTTFKVKVDKVLNGELKADYITFYQHGTSRNPEDAKQHVKLKDKVYLILKERPDGLGYWSYNFEDGIWTVDTGRTDKENIVNSKTNSKNIKHLKGISTTDFEKKIIIAAKNKKLAPGY
jgi:hypothetical protein